MACVYLMNLKEKAMTEAAKPVAWIDEKGQIHHSPRRHFLGLWNDTCGSAEALWYGCSLEEAVAKWKELISRGDREVHLTGFGCGIIADHRELEQRYGEPKGTFMCWVCGRDMPHQHTPEEIERGREHDRWASEQNEKRWAETLTRIASLEARYPPRTPLYAHPPTAGVMEVPSVADVQVDHLMDAIRVYGKRPDDVNERAIRSILQSALSEAVNPPQALSDDEIRMLWVDFGGWSSECPFDFARGLLAHAAGVPGRDADTNRHQPPMPDGADR
jgi:hypothetical protein